ncbi:POK10 protein, partial [Hylia prasina]|nr:POK10 protein [Hylia prasina]
IEGAGFEIATEKIQHTCPWTYLGLCIGEWTIVPQQLTIKDNPMTLTDLHQLCGSINWVRTLLGIMAEDLVPLFSLLRGSDDLGSPRIITPEAQEVIQKVSEGLSTRQAHRADPALPFQFVILDKSPKFHGLIFHGCSNHTTTQTNTTPQELMAQFIIKARARLKTLAGCEFTCIYLPVKLNSLKLLLQTNEHLQFALDSCSGQISTHLPKHKLFNACFNLVPNS